MSGVPPDLLWSIRMLQGPRGPGEAEGLWSTHWEKHDGSTWSQFQLQQSLVQVFTGELPPREHGCQGEVSVAVSYFLSNTKLY